MEQQTNPPQQTKMTTEQKNNLIEEMNILWVETNSSVTGAFPSIYSKSDLQFILKNIEIRIDNMIRRIETSEATPTEVAEQTYTLKEINEAIESLDFDNDDFATLDTDDYGQEVRVRAVTCEHELQDYVQTEVIEFLNNIEK